MSGIDPNARINLSKANVLVVDGSRHAVDMLAQIMRGFGVAEVQRCTSIEDAERALRQRTWDLILIDPSASEGAGYELLNTLRRSPGAANAYAPVILISGHVRASDVARARDTGANFFVTKPITTQVLLQRIFWVARDKRPFVEIGAYVGPDRRFKFDGPPLDSDGRRADDMSDPQGETDEPNMSKSKSDMPIEPQKVLI